jgi:hypothetical protein
LQEQGLQYSPDDLPSLHGDKWEADCKKEQLLQTEFYSKPKLPAGQIQDELTRIIDL